jgi:hypothetical protein
MTCEDLAKLAICSPTGLIALEDSALLLHSLLSHVNNSTLDICLYYVLPMEEEITLLITNIV